MENIKAYMQKIGQQARAASRQMALADSAAKNNGSMGSVSIDPLRFSNLLATAQ